VVVADRQTKGRGRSGNRWESPEGGLWFSVLLRPNIVSSRLPLIQFLFANSTRQALEDETGLPVQLKWPNDLLLNRRKLGGILMESKIQSDTISFVVIGIGLNINLSQEEIPPEAASLQAQTGIRYDGNRILNAIIEQSKSRYKDLNETGPIRILEEWWRHCVHRLARVHVTIDGKTVVGVATSLGEDGSLLIRTDDNRIERVTEGSLTLLKN
jgi:BirA family transcriptional regulator, biotin operon repressor / biotin---[acetyl-CoA-carboxylase] ligase